MNPLIFGQYVLDCWSNFVNLKEVPKIQAEFLPWVIALWIQILLLTIFLIVGFWYLYRRSKKIHKDASEESDSKSNHEGNRQPGQGLYISGLHDLVSTYYKCQVLIFLDSR